MVSQNENTSNENYYFLFFFLEKKTWKSLTKLLHPTNLHLNVP